MKSEIISQSFGGGGEYFIFISLFGGSVKRCSGACVGGFVVVFAPGRLKEKKKRNEKDGGQSRSRGYVNKFVDSLLPSRLCMQEQQQQEQEQQRHNSTLLYSTDV